MIEVGDKVYSYVFPDEYSVGTVISRKSEGVFIAEFINRTTGELFKQIVLDYNIYK